MIVIIFTTQFSFAQKSKDFVIDNNKDTIYGEIKLKDNFWYTNITVRNGEKGIVSYQPHELRKFVKGDSTFVRVFVNEKYGVNDYEFATNFALIVIKDFVNLYKTYLLKDQEESEIFLYYRKSMKSLSVIENSKGFISSIVSDCKGLVNDINSSGYEYNEKYLRKLFEDYNLWIKDHTDESSYAQKTDDQYGYVVTIKGDSIFGRIKSFNECRSCRSVRLIMENDSSRLYSPQELKGYRRNNDWYESQLTTAGNNVFMKRVIAGKLNLYHYTFRSYSTASIGGVVAPVMTYKNIIVYVLKEGEGSPTRIVRAGFKKKMSEYLHDSPELAAQIKNKQLRYDDMFQIVRLYNEKISN